MGLVYAIADSSNIPHKWLCQRLWYWFLLLICLHLFMSADIRYYSRTQRRIRSLVKE